LTEEKKKREREKEGKHSLTGSTKIKAINKIKRFMFCSFIKAVSHLKSFVINFKDHLLITL
jgi:hypothetical protein